MAAAIVAPIIKVHDIIHQIRLLREVLNSEKRRVGFLLGAGCPLGIYDDKDANSLKLIPDVTGLTDAVYAQLTDARKKECWTILIDSCKKSGILKPNVEHILTQVRTICALKGDGNVHDMSSKELLELDKKICELVAGVVGASLPTHRCSYRRFASWLRHIERTEAIEIFTPNYDLLIEQALESQQIPYFDGFVGSREPFFDLLSLEVDSIPIRWARLWKLHGSTNWIKRDDETVFRKYPTTSAERVLIYPSHLKYEQSRRMPYLGMLDRFRAFFGQSHSVLVICGYSFADDHLNEIVIDGLRSNRAIHCYALMYGSLNDSQIAVRLASRHPNLTVLCADGAVVGTREGEYVTTDTDPAAGTGYKVDGSKPTALLGDFHHFALFLETQFGITD
jgi:hypothetical protein